MPVVPFSAGNLACDAVSGGRIIFYDFGMMDELTVPLKRSFSDLIFGIYGNDLKAVVDSLEEMDVIRKVRNAYSSLEQVWCLCFTHATRLECS